MISSTDIIESDAYLFVQSFDFVVNRALNKKASSGDCSRLLGAIKSIGVAKAGM